jgi:hypothetical protein
VVGKYNYDGDGRQWVINQDPNGRINFYTNPTGQLATNEHLWSDDGYQGRWTHVVAVRDGSTKILYIDGAPENTGATAGVVTGKSSKVCVGCHEYPLGRGYFFNGMIDDVRVYNRALSAEEVWELYQEGGGGLIAHWEFEEGEGDIAYDSAGDNDGTIYGATWTSGQIGGGLSFDGDDYVGTLNNVFTNAQLASGATLAAWFKTDSAAYGLIADLEGYLNLGINLRDTINPNKLFGTADGGGAHIYFSSSNVTDNVWHHAAIVWNGTNTASLYLDGVNVSSGFSGPPTPDSKDRPFAIGAHSTIDAYFDGIIDDVRVYNRALSAEEVWELYQGGGGGLIAHWEFDEGEGDIAYDSAGDNDGTIYGATWTSGQIGGGLSFDGDDYVDVGLPEKLDFERTDAYTLSAWQKAEGAAYTLLSKMDRSSHYRGYDIFVAGGYVQAHLINSWMSNSLRETGTLYPVNDFVWHHIAVTYDGSSSPDGLKIYVDSMEEATIVGPHSLSSTIRNSVSFKIGARSEGGEAIHHLTGDVDDVRIYNRALSAEEIQQIYEEGLPGVAVDIRPRSCPNPLNVKSKGILPVAILGTEEFDVYDIDPVSVRLEGVAPIRSSYEDVATPVADGTAAATAIGSEQEPPCQDGECPGQPPCQDGECPGQPPCQDGECPGQPPCQDGECPGQPPCQDGECPPLPDGNECQCTTDGPDGYDDLTLKFRTREIVRELIDMPGELAKGQTLALTVTGELFDGTAIQGADCVILVGNVTRWLAAQRWDVNEDGIVNMLDFAEFANYWLEEAQ